MILENLRSLTELPARCRVVCAPLKVRNANGGPVRVLALLDDAAGERTGRGPVGEPHGEGGAR